MSQSWMIDRLEPRRLLANLINDPTFGQNGYTAGGSEELFVGLSGDGVMTRVTVERSYQTSYSYRRYLKSGLPDPKFVPLNVSSDDWEVTTDSIGRLLVADQTNDAAITVTRYTLTGQVDPTFGKKGVATIYPSELDTFYPSTTIYSVAVGPDDSIFVLAHSGGLGYAKANYTVNKFKADGSIDQKFGKNGSAVISHTNSTNRYPNRVFIDPLGRAHVIVPAKEDGADAWMLLRLTNGGKIDSTFKTISIPSNVTKRSITADAHGRVLMSFNSTVSHKLRGRLMRLDQSGRPDPTFGTSGVATPLDSDFFDVSYYYILPSADGTIEAQFSGKLVHLNEQGQAIQIRQISGSANETIVRAVLPSGQFIADEDLPYAENAIARLVATPFAFVSKNGTLTITGSDDDDAFSLRLSGPAGRVLVGYNGVRLGLFNGVKAITAALGDGNDVLQARTLTQPIAVTGGLGNDTIATGLGTDSIDLGSGSNAVDAGPGGGVITATYAGAISEQVPLNVINAPGQARDRWKIDISYGRSRVSASGRSATVALGTSKSVAILNFKQGVTVYGTAGNDTIYTGRGNDSILGGGGDDLIDAGTGRDTLAGGDGFDRYRVIGDDDSLTGFETVLS